MAIELKVPSLGESVTEVEIGAWLKREGDTVNKDENVVTLESEKATVDLPSPVSGTLGKIVKRTGEKATVGDVIALIESSGKAKAEAKPAAAKAEKSKPETPKKGEGAPAPARGGYDRDSAPRRSHPSHRPPSPALRNAGRPSRKPSPHRQPHRLRPRHHPRRSRGRKRPARPTVKKKWCP